MENKNQIIVPNTSLEFDDGNIKSGSLYASNESRFDAAHFSQPLTAFATGWKDNDDLVSMLEFIAPTVHVGRRFEFKKADNSECFLSEEDDVRAIGSSFKRVEYSGNSVNEKTLNKGLTMRIDHDDVSGDNWQERYVQILIQRMYRNELRRAITALQSIATKPITTIWTGLKGNPDSDLLDAIIKAGNEAGIDPNRALFGRSAWQIRHNAYASSDKAGAFAGLIMQPNQFAAVVGLDDVRISKERFNNTTTGEKKPMVNDSIVVFHGQGTIDKDDASTLKRFVTPIDGQQYRVYIQPHAKYTDITLEHYSNIITTSTLGVKTLKVSSK